MSLKLGKYFKLGFSATTVGQILKRTSLKLIACYFQLFVVIFNSGKCCCYSLVDRKQNHCGHLYSAFMTISHIHTH